MTSFKRLIRGVGDILSPKEKLWLFALALLDMLMSLADLFALAVLLLLINAYTRSNAHPIWRAAQHYLQKNDPVLVTGIFLLLFCLKNLAGAWLAGRQSYFAYDVASRISDERLQLFLAGSYTDFVFTDSAVVQRRINRTPIEFAHYVLTGIQQIIAQCILVALTFCAVMVYRPGLFVLLLVFLLPPFAVLAWYVKRTLNRLRGHIKLRSEQAIQYLQEALGGFVESNIYNRRQFFTGRYAARQQALNNSLGQQQALQGLSARMVELFAVLGFFILLAVNRCVGGQSGIGITTIGVFVISAYKIIPGLVKIINNAGQIKTYGFTLTELQRQPLAKIQQLEMGGPIESIGFSNVSFGYPGKPVLNNVSFSLQPGDIAGIAGSSGRGKTTMLNILLGFLEQSQGEVDINGQVCTADARKNYWPNIAYVKQQDFFINDTIISNITLGDSVDNHRLKRAVDIAGLHQVTMPGNDALEKKLSENGKNISGGQRQRITLARALYRDFDVLLLDEPFSELDAAAAEGILERLTAAFSNKIVLFITHNPNSLQWCNKIIRLYDE